jgi:hypothetical protein
MEDKVVEAYFRTFSRPPSVEEISKGLAFLKETQLTALNNSEKSEATDFIVWKEYCHALFNMKSFIYLL